jgi:hypothetical protein
LAELAKGLALSARTRQLTSQAPKKEVVGVPEHRPFLERLMFGRQHDPRAQREEKVLQYIIHRVNEDAHLHDVLQEPYVRRNCSQGEIDGIVMDPELVHHCRELLERVFGSGDLDPKLRR